jgi:NDP-sugar pyrophosphorylase family protein
MSSLIKPTEDEMIIFIKVAEYLGEKDKQFYNEMYLVGFICSSLIVAIIYIFNPSLLSYQAKERERSGENATNKDK